MHQANVLRHGICRNEVCATIPVPNLFIISVGVVIPSLQTLAFPLYKQPRTRLSGLSRAQNSSDKPEYKLYDHSAGQVLRKRLLSDVQTM